MWSQLLETVKSQDEGHACAYYSPQQWRFKVKLVSAESQRSHEVICSDQNSFVTQLQDTLL